MAEKRTFSLEDKYTQTEGRIILSGIQALVRLPLDQHQADRQRGLNTATLISGYRGSPLGGLDFVLQQVRPLLDEHQVVFMPGVNEDLAATALLGSQIANLMPQPKYDGVVGMWYGKGPGVDRTGDIFKHAAITGVGRYGGVLAVAGDDPTAKSSTIPSHSEVALYDAQMPVLYPGNSQEVLDLGRYGFELSRYSGSWTGFKIVTNVADEFSTAEISSERVKIVDPGFSYRGKPWQHTQNPALLAPYSLDQEREIHEGRLEAAIYFARSNRLNRIVSSTPDDWLGIVTAGKCYYDVREALAQIGLDDEGLRRYGIRLLKLGMLYPLEPEIIKTFGRGLEEILVIEEKRAFVETFLRSILYDLSERPQVIGKKDETGQFLVKGYSELDADEIIQILAKRLTKRVPREPIEARLQVMKGPESPIILPMVSRTPYFCSGCPHNTSTVVPEGSLAGGGIGCHTLALLMDRNVTGVTQMGGEGVQWVGASPFSDMPHMFQNIGDGTLFHSGSMAIRQALTTNTNITYKILFNSAVAMTGGQQADGAMPIPELTRFLQAEGVRRTIVVAKDPLHFPVDAKWADNVEVWGREQLDEAQRILRDIPGVTTLIYDQECAADLRRRRKRGQADEPPMRVFINEAVCEGCGDCGVKSNCLSVFPVETEFGRKTQIHQSSCNKDYSCLNGDCPAFITLLPAETAPAKSEESTIYQVERDLPDPAQKVPDDCQLYLMGIGGTGVVTVNQILGTAALLDGKHVRSLDQTGLSQKGGPVVSHLKILSKPSDVSNKISIGEADAYLVFDLLTGTTEANLSRARPDKTIAIVSDSQIPTGAMIRSTEIRFPQVQSMLELIEERTRIQENLYLDAIHLAETLFGNAVQANMIVVGVAYQAGLIPLTAAAIEQAIELNRVTVEANQQAFRVGRLFVADPDWRNSLRTEPTATLDTQVSLTPQAQALVEMVSAAGELKRLLSIRVPDLIAYQNVNYARQYVDFVQKVYTAEQAIVPGQTRLSEAIARYLFKLMAYKDEYEVARLHLQPTLFQTLAAQFGEDARITYQLHPPFLRYLGLKQKMSFGLWFKPVLQLLAAMRRLRDTPFDPFGYTAVRRLERSLISEYRHLIEAALTRLTVDNYEQAVKLANLPDLIRGYEEVKLKNVARFRQAVNDLKLETISETAPLQV